MVEGVVEVEAVTCSAGDTACPIAVARALERAPILTVTDDDDWDNGRELLIAIWMKQMHFVLCKQCCASSAIQQETAHAPEAYYNRKGVYKSNGRYIYKSEGRFINRKGDL